MPSQNNSKVYIAGVGQSSFLDKNKGDFSATKVVAALVSAASKALLDAGLTCDDVEQCLDCIGSQEAAHSFAALTRSGKKAEQGAGLHDAVNQISNRHSQCILVQCQESSVAVAFVLLSEEFLMSRPYLKDSAVLIHKGQAHSHNEDGTERLRKISQTIWMLRGWIRSQEKTKDTRSVHCSLSDGQIVELTRADGNEVPSWEYVEHRHDGKYRLGYNPALKTVEISQEDYEAVRASNSHGGEREHQEPNDAPAFTEKGGDRAALAKL